MSNVYDVRKLHPFQEKNKSNALPNMMDYWGNYLNIDVCTSLLTEMDP